MTNTNIKMKIKLRTFGKFTEFISDNVLELENHFDTDSLQIALKKKYPFFDNAKYFLVVDNKMVLENSILAEHSVVDIMPPFSGG